MFFFTALFFAFNEEGVENVSQLHYSQYKIDTTSVYSLPLSSKVEKAIVKKNKVISIQPFRQTLSLGNH